MARDPRSLVSKSLKPRFILGMLALILVVLAHTKPLKIEAIAQNQFSVKLGKEFELKKGQRAALSETNFEIEILNFFNKPCPPNVNCIWSGIGIEFEYRNDGQTKRGINLAKAFGYEIRVIRSDYENYAILKITKNEES